MNSFKLLPCGRIIFFNKRLNLPAASVFMVTTEGDCAVGKDVSIDSTPMDASGSYLGSSHAVISDNVSTGYKKARKGTKGITSHGRNSIRAGCSYLEERFGVKNLTFLTATLPDEAMRACTPETWALVLNRFEKSIRYHLEKAGLCPEIVGCVEVQEKRLLTTDGIPPLHLHLVFQGRKGWGHWAIDKTEYQRLWSQACKSVWSLECKFEQSCRSESVKSSSVSYMSKYLSKGGSVLPKCKPELLPTAWFSVSKNVKEMIKRTILRGENYLAMNLFEQVQDSSILKWARDVWTVEHGDGSQYLIAWVGQIASRETFWELHKKLTLCISVNTEAQNKSYSFGL